MFIDPQSHPVQGSASNIEFAKQNNISKQLIIMNYIILNLININISQKGLRILPMVSAWFQLIIIYTSNFLTYPIAGGIHSPSSRILPVAAMTGSGGNAAPVRLPKGR